MDARRLSCCGIMELQQLSYHRSNPVTILKAFGDCFYKPLYSDMNEKFRYALFSAAGKRSAYGNRFAAYIRANKLGDVIETGMHVNPNSGNLLKAFLWTVDHDAVKACLVKLKWKPYDRS
jgi:hypothetical protein